MKFRKSLLTLACTLILAAFGQTAVALPEENNDFILKVGYFPNYGVFKDANGTPYGYVCDYFDEIARINGWKVQYLPYDWATGLQRLESGEIDTFGGMQKTPDRELLYDYPEYSMGFEYGSLFVRADNDEIFFDDLASMDGKKVGVSTNNYYTGALEEFCAKNGISVTIVEKETTKQLDQALLSGIIDMRVSGSMLAPRNAKVVLQFCTEEFYFPTTKGNTYVLDGFNHALEQIRRTDIYYTSKLFDKYYTKSAVSNKAFSLAEQEFIRDAPPLKVGFDAKAKPITYFNTEIGSADGILIDLMEDISKYSGLKFEYANTKSYGEAFFKTQNGELDLVLGAGSRAQQDLALTEPLFNTTLAFIVKRGKEYGEQRLRMSVLADEPLIKEVIDENYPDAAQVRAFSTTEGCLNAVMDDTADVAVLNVLMADRALKLPKYQALSIDSMRGGELPLCIGISPDSPPELLAVLNKAIASISIGRVNQVAYNNTIGIPYNPTAEETFMNYSPVIILSVFLFFGTLLAFSAASRKKLNRTAYYDPLTGEMNLNKFNIETKKLFAHATRPYAITAIDINRFKAINDLYGYEFGDVVLKTVAQTLNANVNSESIICRGAADRFYIFCKFNGRHELEQDFYKFAAMLDKVERDDGASCKIVFSAGTYVMNPGDENNMIAIIDRANIASKSVKNTHVSVIAFYDQSMYDKINNEKLMENQMASAIENEEFVVYLQPKIDLKTRSIMGAEALVRWQHPEKGFLSPADFVPLFEENGFIVNLDFYVFRRVCRLFAKWQEQGRKLFVISVNLSRRHLENADTVERLSGICESYGVSPSLIEIELTESAFVNCEVGRISEVLNKMHNCGFSVSVDDFGAGYSALSLLKDLPIDVLKIDKSFLESENSDKSDKVEMLLESVISLSRKMDIMTVSEGVETKQQVDLLVHLGCDLVQGYYFARPMTIEQLESLLDSGGLADL